MQMQVGILTLLFNKRESYPLLLDLFLSEGWVQRFWIGGLLDFGANGPLNQNEMIQSTTSWNSLVSRNRIWRRDFWRTISSKTTDKPAPSAARRINPYRQERHLVSPLKFLAKNLDLTESEEPNTDSCPLHRLEFKAMIPSLIGI